MGFVVQDHMKDFAGWHKRKQFLDVKASTSFFNEGQVWWCSIGVNIGYEIFGKSDVFTRPVLILKKYSKQTFFGLPMTSKIKNYPSRYSFTFQGETSSVILDQGRAMDSKLLLDRLGEVPKAQFEEIRKAFKAFH